VKVLKINGHAVKATEFAWDGCHKVYLVTTPAGREQIVDCGYDMLPVSELPAVWERTCFLRFINPADLHGPSLVEQGEDAVVTYEEA
jgi:hypothetical protein